MAENTVDEIEEIRKEANVGKGSKRHGVLDETIEEIEKQLPENVEYVTGFVVDDELNTLILKKGKLMVGKDLNDAKPVHEFVTKENAIGVMNAVLMLKASLRGYLEFLSGTQKVSAEEYLDKLYG